MHAQHCMRSTCCFLSVCRAYYSLHAALLAALTWILHLPLRQVCLCATALVSTCAHNMPGGEQTLELRFRRGGSASTSDG